jgi:monomeric sarcosine oxidase
MEHPSVVVVGGGVMGLATGSALAGAGARVTVLERFQVAHRWASSHGFSRAIRHEYGNRPIYTEMVAQSLRQWDELAAEAGEQLYVETGVLTLGEAGDGETLHGYEVMRRAGLPVELLTGEECRKRFPQFDVEEFDAITYNPRGGFLLVDECMLALRRRLESRGGKLREGARVTRVESASPGARIILETGETLAADRVVVTAGPWVRDVLPEWSLPVRPTRQQVCYLRGLPLATFGLGIFPIFLARMEFYGFPLYRELGFKVGSHVVGSEVDPNVPYDSSQEEVERVRAFLHRVIPAAAEAPLESADMCMYDVSPDEDFILDHLPGAPEIIVGSGFSGHGFKFGVLIGELLAALALGLTPAFPLDRFLLRRFDSPRTASR